MRLPIAFKIFGIAGFLAVLMIAAAVMSELRVREANRRVHALAGYLLPISDLAADFRAVTLEEEIHFRHVVAILTLRHTDNPLPAETLDRFRSYEERRATLVAAKSMRGVQRVLLVDHSERPGMAVLAKELGAVPVPLTATPAGPSALAA